MYGSPQEVIKSMKEFANFNRTDNPVINNHGCYEVSINKHHVVCIASSRPVVSASVVYGFSVDGKPISNGNIIKAVYG